MKEIVQYFNGKEINTENLKSFALYEDKNFILTYNTGICQHTSKCEYYYDKNIEFCIKTFEKFQKFRVNEIPQQVINFSVSPIQVNKILNEKNINVKKLRIEIINFFDSITSILNSIQ